MSLKGDCRIVITLASNTVNKLRKVAGETGKDLEDYIADRVTLEINAIYRVIARNKKWPEIPD